MRSRFTGKLLDVRAVEDAIRASKKYSEYISSRFARHPLQGDEVPSRMLTKYYEVYPESEFNGIDMSIIDAVFWLADSPSHVDVRFEYNYSCNRAAMQVRGRSGEELNRLKEGIPGFGEAMEKIAANGHKPE